MKSFQMMIGADGHRAGHWCICRSPSRGCADGLVTVTDTSDTAYRYAPRDFSARWFAEMRPGIWSMPCGPVVRVYPGATRRRRQREITEMGDDDATEGEEGVSRH